MDTAHWGNVDHHHKYMIKIQKTKEEEFGKNTTNIDCGNNTIKYKLTCIFTIAIMCVVLYLFHM